MKKLIKENISVSIASLFTLIMLSIGLVFSVQHYGKTPSMAEIGAFLSGIFAPIAWVWFLASYAIQSSELKLQRKELNLQRKALEKQVEELEFTREEITLQRQALQHQVDTQKGSEQALLTQSEVLQEQLKITVEQIERANKERINNLPKFIIQSCSLFDLVKDQIKQLDFCCELPIINIGSDAKLRFVEVHSLNLTDNVFRASINKENNLITINSSFNIIEYASNCIDDSEFTDEVNTLDFKAYKLKAYIDILTKLELKIYYYSERTGSGLDEYIIQYQEGKVTLKLKEDFTA